MSETIDAEEARRLIGSGEAKPVDVRDEEDFEDARIPGSLFRGEGERSLDLSDVPEDMKLILIGPEDRTSAAIDELNEAGRDDVVVLAGGVDAWRKEDFATEPSEDPDDDAVV